MTRHLSASQLKKHADCPKRWWFRYVSDEEREDEDTRYLDLGNAVHDALEEVLSEHRGQPDLMERAEAAYSHYAAKHGVPTDMIDDGLDYTRLAVEYFIGQEPEVLDIEERVEFEVDRPGIEESYVGYMDVAASDAIWDWKTGSIRDDTPFKEKVQAGVYVAAYLARYGHAPDEVRFIYLKEGQVRKLTPDQDLAATVTRETLKLLQNQRNEEFPTNPGDRCYWCPYEHACPKNGGVVPDSNFDWNDWSTL